MMKPSGLYKIPRTKGSWWTLVEGETRKSGKNLFLQALKSNVRRESSTCGKLYLHKEYL